MKFYTVAKLGPKQEVTPEGFLLCKDVPIARTGFQTYGPDETPVELGPDGIVIIERPESEVFRAETIASGTGKPVTEEHPPMPEDEDAWTVDPDNWTQYSVGVTIDPRRGTGELTDTLVADLLICSKSAIDSIRDKRLVEVSCGYSAGYDQLAPGKGRQKDIIINHVALVGLGRCGPRCAIHDNKATCHCNDTEGVPMRIFKDVKDRIRTAFKAHDEAGMEKTLNEVKDEVPVEPSAGDNDLKELREKVASHDALHNSHTARLNSHDAAIASHEQKIKEMEKGPEGEEVTDDEMKPEVEAAMHDKIRQTKDSSLLQSSYQAAISGAEILTPGIRVFTFDRAAAPAATYKQICGLRRQALDLANRGADAVLVLDVMGGRRLTDADLAAMPCQQVKTTFDALVALKKRANNDSSRSSSSVNPNGGKRPPKTIADLNKEAKEAYKGRV